MTGDLKNKKREMYVKLKRGEVATSFAFIEDLISRVITFYYLKRDDGAFTSEVMEDEYFSFGLKANILRKIVKNHYPKFPVNKLHELGRIRNIITHSTLIASAQMVKGTNVVLSIGEMKFRHNGKDHDIDELFSKFDELAREFQTELAKIPGGFIAQVEMLPMTDTGQSDTEKSSE